MADPAEEKSFRFLLQLFRHWSILDPLKGTDMNTSETLSNLTNEEVDSRTSELGKAVANAGYDQSPRGLINSWDCWGITVGEFLAMLSEKYSDYTLPVSDDPSYYGAACSADDAAKIAAKIGELAKSEFPGLSVEIFHGVGSGAVRGPDSAVCEDIREWVEANWPAAL